MDALVRCPPSFGCYTKAAKTRWLNCSPFVNAKIKCSPYLELLIVLCFIRPWRKPMRLCLDLRVGLEEVLGFLVPWQTIVLVLLVRLCLLILVILLSNQKANIHTWGGWSQPLPTHLEELVKRLCLPMSQQGEIPQSSCQEIRGSYCRGGSNLYQYDGSHQ
jgi:hypothetical protein